MITIVIRVDVLAEDLKEGHAEGKHNLSEIDILGQEPYKVGYGMIGDLIEGAVGNFVSRNMDEADKK